MYCFNYHLSQWLNSNNQEGFIYFIWSTSFNSWDFFNVYVLLSQDWKVRLVTELNFIVHFWLVLDGRRVFILISLSQYLKLGTGFSPLLALGGVALLCYTLLFGCCTRVLLEAPSICNLDFHTIEVKSKGVSVLLSIV